MKKIAIASGKGGVGKSMLSSSLSILFSSKKNVVAVDCDVDAPNLAVWLGDPENWKEIKKISVSEKPVIDNKKIDYEEAKLCVQKCRFNALKVKNRKLVLNPFLCEGCGACEVFCPAGAIKMKAVKNGEIKIKKTKYGFPLVSGQLYPGESGSGKIVTEIRRQAEEFKGEIMIVDSAPGTSCPVIASLQNVDFVVFVTEPTPSAFSDLKKVLNVAFHFNIPWGLVINKYGLNEKLGKKIEKWAGENMIGKISYDKEIFRAISNLRPVMETNLPAKKEIEDIYKTISSRSL